MRSEGFEANRRAVAETKANRSARSGWKTEPASVGRRKYLETPDIQRWVRAARRERSVYDPGRSRTAPPDGAGNKTYKPEGEVAENAVREVGVTRSTREPQQNKSCGTASNQWGGGVATQKAPLRGKGSRWRWQKTDGGRRASRDERTDGCCGNDRDALRRVVPWGGKDPEATTRDPGRASQAVAQP